jgi:hypothetical protein
MKFHRRFLIVLLFLGLATPYFSQSKSSDVDFGFYLFEMRKFDEILLLFEDVKFDNTPMFDSIHHILGMTHYYRKELEKSAFHLFQVSPSSTFYDKSIFFGALDFAHLGDYAKARTILENYQATHNDRHEDLLNVQLAGLSLLERDFKTFDRHSEQFKFDHFHYVNSQNQLMKVRGTLGDFRPKSPFVAGLLSAVVPGAGKVYAGQLGEGVATFLTVGSLAAITAEIWAKNGFLDWKTITVGTIFSIFYIGNIAGSVISVKIYRNQFYDLQNNTILLGIHLPIRTVFN